MVPKPSTSIHLHARTKKPQNKTDGPTLRSKRGLQVPDPTPPPETPALYITLEAHNRAIATLEEQVESFVQLATDVREQLDQQQQQIYWVAAYAFCIGFNSNNKHEGAGHHAPSVQPITAQLLPQQPITSPHVLQQPIRGYQPASHPIIPPPATHHFAPALNLGANNMWVTQQTTPPAVKTHSHSHPHSTQQPLFSEIAQQLPKSKTRAVESQAVTKKGWQGPRTIKPYQQRSAGPQNYQQRPASSQQYRATPHADTLQNKTRPQQISARSENAPSIWHIYPSKHEMHH
jgi:hypothetical protein